MRFNLPIIAVAATLTATGSVRQALAFRTAADLDEFEGSERVAWDVDEVAVQLSSTGPEPFEFDKIEDTIRSAADVWSEPSCGALQFVYSGLTSEVAEPGDGDNTIQWIEDWSDRGFPPDAAAITDVQYAGRDGDWSIIEADVYMNGRDMEWAIASSGGGAREVLAVLVHEMGHMLGLLHPCEEYGLDGAPDCYEEGFDRETTMYPLYDSEQRSLGFDDIGGMCFLYPAAEPLPERGADPCADQSCPCDDESNCPLDYSCEKGFCAQAPDTKPNGDFTPGCEGCGEEPESLKAFGEVCSEANECVGGQCLAGLSEFPVCTHTCKTDAQCPSAWFCTSVENKDVCTPAYLAAGGGCSMGQRDSRPASAAFLAFLGVPLAIRRSRTRRHLNFAQTGVRRSS